MKVSASTFESAAADSCFACSVSSILRVMMSVLSIVPRFGSGGRDTPHFAGFQAACANILWPLADFGPERAKAEMGRRIIDGRLRRWCIHFPLLARLVLVRRPSRLNQPDRHCC